MREAVEHAYRVFERYRPGVSLTVCRRCCVEEETEQALVQTPLREISSRLLAEYTDSAHGWDDENISREMRWFLPRYFELIALDDPPEYSLGLGMTLRRMGEGAWRTLWPVEEVEAVDRYFDALVAFNIARPDMRKDWHLEEPGQFVELLELVARAGGDVGRVLRIWEAAPDPAAAVEMATARRFVATEGEKHRLVTCWLQDVPVESERIGAFLMQLSIARRIMAAAEVTGNARLLELSPINFPHERSP